MSEKVKKDVAQSFANASVAAEQHRLYAIRAEQEGKEMLACLLQALAASERVHARRTMMHLRGKVGDSGDYVAELSRRRRKDFTLEFFRIAEALTEEGRDTTAEAFGQFGEVAKNHFDLLNRFQKDQIDCTAYHVCQVCGYIAVEAPPENCPVCGAVRKKFKSLDETG